MPLKNFYWMGKLPSHRSFRPYVTAIGQAAVAWNGLQEAMRSLFSIVMGGGWVGRYSAVWNALSNDAAQRDMLVAAAQFATDMGEISLRGYEDIKWLVSEARKVSEARNDTIHAPIISVGAPGYERIMAESTFGNRRARNLMNKDLLTEYRWCRDAAVVLTDFCMRLDLAVARNPGALTVAAGKVWPWPERPKLPNRGQKKVHRDRGRQSHPKPRQRPPES